MLKTETNTPEMERRVLRAFHRAGHLGRIRGRTKAQAHFEHGQWWITLPGGAAYSVVDVEGTNAPDGFDFEQVAEGEA